jgi:hypothetical protein
MNKKPVFYLQNDARWGKLPYTIDNDPKETIGSSGCGVTCVAMLLSTFFNEVILPPEMARLAITMHDRTANSGTEWDFFGHVASKYNLGFKQTGDLNPALRALQGGAYVIVSMGPGVFTFHGHYILLWNYDGRAVSVNDPASVARTNKVWSPAIFRQQARQYFIFNLPQMPNVAAPPPHNSHITPVKEE